MFLQIYPRFGGWITQLFSKFFIWNNLYLRIYHLSKNQSQITRQSSKCLQALNNFLNKQIKSTLNITLDVGVTIKEFHAQWNQSEIGQKLLQI